MDNIGQVLYIDSKNERQTHLTRLSQGCPSHDKEPEDLFFDHCRGEYYFLLLQYRGQYVVLLLQMNIHPCFYPIVSIHTRPLLTLLVVLTLVQPEKEEMF